MILSARQVLEAIKAKGYKTFETKHPFDLNIFGIRSASTVPNRFDDVIGCVYRDKTNEWKIRTWSATTDPGTYWLENYRSDRVSGTAILVPGQYRGVYKLDHHAGKYLALCQRNGPVKVYRDSNRDQVLDWTGDTREGMYGINIHRASLSGSAVVDRWSAGCQVFASPFDFAELMQLAIAQLTIHPTYDSFTYTLLEEGDLR
jgi:hypothetical protein